MNLRNLFAASAIALLAGCGLTDMPNKMDASLQKMQDMNKAIHNQTLLVALDHLFSDENTENLVPVPTGMMPYGQGFADEMHEDDFVKFVDLKLQEINNAQPDDSKKDQSGKWPADLAAKEDRKKTVTFYAIMIISGLANQGMIDQVVNTEIVNGGQYTTAAYAILEARSLFIHDVLLEETLLLNPLDTPGKISKAMEYAQDLDFIETLPFAAAINLKITGMLLSEDNADNELDRASSIPIWAQIDQAFDTDLQKKFMSGTTNGLRERVHQACRARGNWDNKTRRCTPAMAKLG